MALCLWLLLGIVTGLKGQENGTGVDYFRVECGSYEIDPFKYRCHEGIGKKCDESVCRLSKEETARKRCALFCGQVKHRLIQLPKRVAELENAHEELITDNSKLKKVLATKNHSISEERRQTEDLRTQLQNYMILTIVFVIVVVALFIAVIVLVVKVVKMHGRGQRSRMSDDNESFIPNTTIGIEEDSAIESDLHRCEEKVKPTDDDQSAPLAVNELQPLPSKING